MKPQQPLTAIARQLAATIVVAAGTIGAAQAGTVNISSTTGSATITASNTNPVSGATAIDFSAAASASNGSNPNWPGSGISTTGGSGPYTSYYYGYYNAGPWKLAVDATAYEGLVKGTYNAASPNQTYAAPVDVNGNAVTGYYLSTGGYSTTAVASSGDGATAASSAFGAGDIQLSFTTAQAYFGLLWGSIGSGDVLSFYNGTTLLASITGAQALSAAAGMTGFTGGGGQGAGGSEYFLVNFTGVKYTSVVFGNSVGAQPSFESANFSYSATNVPGTVTASSVPEPESFALLGIGLAGLLAVRRRRA